MNIIKFFLSLFFSSALFCCVDSESYKEIFNSILKKDPHLNIGVVIEFPNRVKPFYIKNQNKLFTPASCTKLFTAAAALHIIGPEFCFRTSVYIEGTIFGDALFGNLYIKASGDPSFKTQDLVELIRKIRARGINKITGHVYLDTSLFEDNVESYYGKGFCLDDMGASYMQPVTACIIDKNEKTIKKRKKKVLLNPHEHICLLIEKLFKKYAISYRKPVTKAVMPSNVHEIVYHTSEPLASLLSHMLKESDNLYANAIFKYIGAYQTGMPGTWKNGKEVMRDFLKREMGIQPDSYVIEDGAGLSRYNLISPVQVVRLLTWIYDNKRLFSVFRRSLALSGIDGTLQHRMIEYPGIVAAKTGTMKGVSSLSGYICLENREPIIFSIMLNGFVKKRSSKVHINYKRDIEDTICMNVIRICQSGFEIN